MANITSREDLSRWLTDKPTDWAQVIALRAALRALPYAFGRQISALRVSSFAPVLFRAVSIAWTASNWPENSVQGAVPSALEAFLVVERATDGHVDSTSTFSVATYSIYAAVRATDAADSFSASAEAQAAAADAARVADSRDQRQIWESLTQDCNWLETKRMHPDESRGLSGERLWYANLPNAWMDAWCPVAVGLLLSLDPTYQVWIDWYHRRIDGFEAAFDIPGDVGRTEDKAILARLTNATDADFWGRGTNYVNTTLQGWIDEARARVAPPSADTAPLPAQNQNAIPFAATADGKIAIDPTRNADALRTDAEARDRYDEAIREAQALLARCRLSNSAARFVGGFENYLAAGGDALADMRPSLFVQRGEKLRQEIAAYENDNRDSFLEPIADDLLIDLKGWRSAHNMVVGLDPVLMRLDTAMLGPDVRSALIPPTELRTFVADADEANILDEGVREIVDEAISLAPAIPDASDRRTVWSVESVQNLVIEAFSVALQHPGKVAAGAAFTAVVGVPVAASVFGGALVCAKFLIKHRHWIETKLNDTPTWKSLFVQLCDKMEQVTPFKRAGDDDGV
jgi:hypothetical protein